MGLVQSNIVDYERLRRERREGLGVARRGFVRVAVAVRRGDRDGPGVDDARGGLARDVLVARVDDDRGGVDARRGPARVERQRDKRGEQLEPARRARRGTEARRQVRERIDVQPGLLSACMEWINCQPLTILREG